MRYKLKSFSSGPTPRAEELLQRLSATSKPNITLKVVIQRTSSLKTSKLYSTEFFGYKYESNRKFFKDEQVLNLNFRRSKFFPSIRSRQKHHVFVTTSLGLFWKYFFKPKCFKRNKALYLVTASFLRKILLFCSFVHLYLYINRTPRYFNEILNKITEPSVSIYPHPFSEKKTEVIEGDIGAPFSFSTLMFFNAKNYGWTKMRKRGRLKRRIYRRLVAVNRVLD